MVSIAASDMSRFIRASVPSRVIPTILTRYIDRTRFNGKLFSAAVHASKLPTSKFHDRDAGFAWNACCRRIIAGISGDDGATLGFQRLADGGANAPGAAGHGATRAILVAFLCSSEVASLSIGGTQRQPECRSGREPVTRLPASDPCHRADELCGPMRQGRPETQYLERQLAGSMVAGRGGQVPSALRRNNSAPMLAAFTIRISRTLGIVV